MNSQERHAARRKRREAARLQKKQERFKEYDNYNSVFSMKHLFTSYKLTRKNVGWKASTQKYTIFFGELLIKTFNELMNQTFHRDKFYEFYLMERGKLRHIRSVTIRERVVQRCLCDYCLVPILSNRFIYDNTASLKGKGYLFSWNRVSKHLHDFYKKYNTNGYILLFDFHGYFESIPHSLLQSIISDNLHDDKLKKLAMHFVEAFPGKKGLGLGSQISQILALAAADSLDHYIKEVLRIKYYGRYMDDGYLMSNSKEYLQHCLKLIKQKCDELGLELNIKKTQIMPITNFTFIKTRFFLQKSGKVVRKIYRNSVLRMRRKLKKLKLLLEKKPNLTLNDIYNSFQSWKSYALKFNARKTILSMVQLFINLFPNNQGGNNYGYSRLLYNKV